MKKKPSWVPRCLKTEKGSTQVWAGISKVKLGLEEETKAKRPCPVGGGMFGQGRQKLNVSRHGTRQEEGGREDVPPARKLPS